MREILFRGKDKDDGKWYEGAYRKYDDTTYCFKEDYDSHPENTHHTIVFSKMTDWGLPNRHLQSEVIPKTVGEYIGFADKNDKRIFEGDIVKCHYETYTKQWDECFEVIYFDGAFGLKTSDNQHFIPFGRSTHRYCEIIGNIHDNPELLEDKQ